MSLIPSAVLCLGLLQDGDVGVGVFPEGERKEIFVGGERRTRAASASAPCKVLDSKALATSQSELPSRS
jgi:hypothetical protein